MRLKSILLIIVCWSARPALAADPQPYSVKFEPTGIKALDSALKATSQLDSLRTSAPAGPFALIGRAQSDIERLQTVCESFGYYRRAVTITIAGHPLEDVDLPGELLAMPKSPAVAVQVKVQLGPLYHLRKVAIEGDVSDKARAAFGLSSGAPAVASQVLAAGQRLQDAMQEEGHAFASVEAPIAYEDANDPVLDVTFKATAGPVYHIGEISIHGLTRMHSKFVQDRLTVHPGDLYRPSQVEKARSDLLALGVFSGVSVQLPKQSEVSGDTLPISYEVTERKRHAVSVTAGYSTDLGGSGGATWTDRNAFGNAEVLQVTANVVDLGGSATKAPGYQVLTTLTKPDFLRSDQSIQYSLGLLKQDLDAYDQDAATAGVAVNRTLSSRWKAGIGLTLEHEEIIQQEVVEAPKVVDGQEVLLPNGQPELAPTAEDIVNHYTLLAIPITLKYDTTGLSNPLEDPTRGVRLSTSLAPTESFNSTANADATADLSQAGRTPHATFLVVQGQFSTYLDLNQFGWSSPGRSVLAFRALAARSIGASQFALPPDQRFYGGGSATVRGYAYQSLGPVIPGTETPAGGVELAATGIEFRRRFYTNWAAAVFADAGAVTPATGLFGGKFNQRKEIGCYATTPGTTISSGKTVQIVPGQQFGRALCEGVGLGTGVRYYTPIGPVRVDLAFPIERTQNSGAFQVYIGLGQSF
jgi:translocation and assembly module TamA